MRRVSLPLVALCCVLLLAACGRQLGPICTSMGTGGPGTLSTGAITIATDHSVYAPSDTVHITITSHLEQAVRLGVFGDCSPLFVQRQVGGSWQQQACVGAGSSEGMPVGGSFKIALVPSLPLSTDFALQGAPYAGDTGKVSIRALVCSSLTRRIRPHLHPNPYIVANIPSLRLSRLLGLIVNAVFTAPATQWKEIIAICPEVLEYPNSMRPALAAG